jgi:hypothetical protein
MKSEKKIDFTLTRDEINQAIAEFAAKQLKLEDADTSIQIRFREGYIDAPRNTIKDVVSASGTFVLSE